MSKIRQTIASALIDIRHQSRTNKTLNGTARFILNALIGTGALRSILCGKGR
jgi:hypothetical protein